ncbi:hypothetical protein NV226_02045 [Mycoplasma iguanae]|uniref:DUF3899 domain-containing protein n=1 Tax=Mycoplasma iguanae TaxID=292461 RepID=A0ABY5R893_9MOLU|nr:hypothetical protein [Mycoplasma iguanae]UVD81496.1 hypothetical protein NV226_02045 [Mycoplasma iguanae]
MYKDKELLYDLILMNASESPVGRLSGVFLEGLPTWAFYLFGVLWLLLGIAFLGLTPFNNIKVKEYKQKQIEKYKKDQKIKHNITYEKAKLVLPLSQKLKLSYAPLLGIVFIVIGISWILGRTL